MGDPCKVVKFGQRCQSQKPAGHEHFSGCSLGILRWWDDERCIRVNGKPGDDGPSLLIDVSLE